MKILETVAECWKENKKSLTFSLLKEAKSNESPCFPKFSPETLKTI